MPATIMHKPIFPPHILTLAPTAWVTPVGTPLVPPNLIPLSGGSTNSCKSNVKGRVFAGGPVTQRFHSGSLPNLPNGSVKTGPPDAMLPPTGVPVILQYLVPIDSRNVKTRDGKKFGKKLPSVTLRHSGFPAPNVPAGPATPVLGSFLPSAQYSHISVRS